MRTYILIVSAFLIFSCNNSKTIETKSSTWPTATAPIAEKKVTTFTAHGDTRNDEYYWMNAYFKKTADSTKAVDYLKEENRYLDTMMAPTNDLQAKLFTEMKARIKEKDETPPIYSNGYFYYTRTEEGKEYYKYCRRKGSMDGPEEILLDVDKMAKEFSYFAIGRHSVSPDNTMLAYGVDSVSRRQFTIYIKNLETGEIYADRILNTESDPVWGNDNKTIFYTSKNPITLLSEKIKRHTMGDNTNPDATVYEEKDPSNYIGVSKTRSNKYILIQSLATLSSQVMLLDANKPTGSFKVFQPRIKDVIYKVDNWENKFLVLTNKDAKNFKLMETLENMTAIGNWKDVIPHNPDVLIDGVDAFKDFWVISERAKGLRQLLIHSVDSSKDYALPFEEAAYEVTIGSNPEYNMPVINYNYTSLTTPNSIYEFDVKTHQKKLIKQEEVLGNFNKDNYTTERINVTARDGAQIPVSIVYKKGFKKDGSSPFLLYGYGSYGVTSDLVFESNIFSLLDRGFVYAIAHIRGGQELGRSWYEDGKMMKKKNTFNDFIDCGESMIKQQYTSKGHLYATGLSAGGLLMGAVTNMAPDLWNGVIAGVPFVDVLTTMSDAGIPLTTNEYDEWGNPADSASYFYMKSYSPYDNVEKKNYPNLLVLTGLHDSQVQYFEPSKWVARLRAMKTNNNALLLKTDMSFGHGGASGRFDYLKDEALEYAFLFKLEGISQ